MISVVNFFIQLKVVMLTDSLFFSLRRASQIRLTDSRYLYPCCAPVTHSQDSRCQHVPYSPKAPQIVSLHAPPDSTLILVLQILTPPEP